MGREIKGSWIKENDLGWGEFTEYLVPSTVIFFNPHGSLVNSVLFLVN